ncbi:MAG: hypothetical protein ACRDGT_02005 [Candidatus Limnocylindria bacterium]
MARIVYADEFSSDLERDVGYLQRIQQLDWVRTLMEDLSDIEGLLEHFPRVGYELARRGTEALLRLRMRRAPYYVWYSYDEATGQDGAITLLRLFHTKQQTPEPRLP